MYRFRSPLLCGTLSFLASVTEWKPVTVRDLLVSNKIYHTGQRNCLKADLCVSLLKRLVYIRDLGYIDCRQESLHVMIYVEKATVIWWYLARIKCGNIVPGWVVDSFISAANVVDCVISWRNQVCRGARVYCLKAKNDSWVFSVSYFVLDSRFWAQKRWILGLFYSCISLSASYF